MSIIEYEKHFHIGSDNYMNKRNSYNTKQKERILDVIKKQKKEFMIKDIYDSLNKEVGLTTIYRMVDKLIEEGIVNKYISKDNNTYYRYLRECDEENHFYLRCDNCGDLVHVDCDCIDELSNHIFKHHKFKPSKEHIIIEGTCSKCIKKGV